MTDKETLLVTSVWQYGGCSASIELLCQKSATSPSRKTLCLTLKDDKHRKKPV
jgi:hypothetical protein